MARSVEVKGVEPSLTLAAGAVLRRFRPWWLRRLFLHDRTIVAHQFCLGVIIPFSVRHAGLLFKKIIARLDAHDRSFVRSEIKLTDVKSLNILSVYSVSKSERR